MVKRQAERDISPYSKRQKPLGDLNDTKPSESPVAINSWRDLQQLIIFSQGNGTQLRHNVQQLKAFLDSILYGDEPRIQSSRRRSLLEYLQSQSDDRKSNSVYLSDLIQSWSFATQTNNEHLFSAIVAVLALFLKTLSSGLEFREYGNQLCRTLLDESQLKLFDRGLSDPKARKHVVSPCLRLLTEIVLHDGGSAAKLVWRCRETTFKRLEAFLAMRKDYPNTLDTVKRKPSIRDNALRYLLANLKLQNPVAKAGILSLAQGKVARSLFRDLKQDSPAILVEMLSVFQKDVLADDGIPKRLKNVLFREGTLSNIASLYNYEEPGERLNQRSTVREATQSFLLLACTSPTVGLLERRKEGHRQQKDEIDSTSQTSDLAMTEEISSLGHEGRPSFRNKNITSFLQGLRPWANSLEKDLVLATFKAASELLQDYFEKKKSFTFEPKLSATWVGYSMFLISTIQLPIADTYLDIRSRFRTAEASSISAIIGHILPSPLTQKSLTKCLNQSVTLVTFLTLKILISAFEKFQCLRKKLQHLESGTSSFIEKLTATFLGRCPELRHVIAGFRSCSFGVILQREAYARLLSLYYRVIPQLALQEKFDISSPLSEALHGRRSSNSSGDGLRGLELESLLDIAKRSPDMRWFHKLDSMPLSTFSMVLKVHAESSESTSGDLIRSLLQSVVEDNRLMEYDQEFSSIDILCYCLRKHESPDLSTELYEFLDSCILKCSRKSVLYYEERNTLIQRLDESYQIKGRKIDLLMMGIADQWPFLVKAVSPATVLDISRFLKHYLNLAMQTGRNRGLLVAIRDRLKDETPDKDCRNLLRGALSESSPMLSARKLDKFRRVAESKSTGAPNKDATNGSAEALDHLLPRPLPEEDEDHKVLTYWIRETIPEVVLEGTLGELILYLCSKYIDIRKQALTSLRTFRESIKISDWSEALQLYMLIGELVETTRNHPVAQPLPYLVGVFAAQSCRILTDPLHPMYIKINKFLHKGPEWNVNKMPSYWVDRVLLHPPTDDEGYRAEVEWLLDFLLDGLRTPEDMEIYRRCNIFERLLTLNSSASLPTTCREKILHLLYRCNYVEGSTTLITRYGLLSWIRSELVIRSDKTTKFLLRSLAKRAYETCDRDKVDEWAGGAAIKLVGL